MSFNYLIFRPSQNKLSNVLTTDNEIIGFTKLVEVVVIVIYCSMMVHF